jgi:hypothetical protein
MAFFWVIILLAFVVVFLKITYYAFLLAIGLVRLALNLCQRLWMAAQ